MKNADVARPKQQRSTRPSRGRLGVKHPRFRRPDLSYQIPSSDLEQAIQRYVDLYEFAPVAYVSFDRSGRIDEANLAASQLFGAPRNLLVGCPLSMFVTQEDLGLFLNHLLRCRSGAQKFVETELKIKRRNGEIIQVHLNSTPLASTRMRNGARLFLTAIVDLTEQKRTEEIIRRSEQRYRTLFELVPVAMYTCDANGFILEYNERAVELWGQEPGENGSVARFCGCQKIYHPDGRPMPPKESPMARALNGQKLKPEKLEFIIERSEGERRHVIAVTEVVRDDGGRIVEAINCLHDMTERKRAEAAALRLAAIVQSSHDAIAAKDLNGIITDWNKSAERIFGYKKQEVIGKSILLLIPPERHSEEAEILTRTRHGQSIDHYETVRRRKDGTLIDVSLTISPIKDRAGKIVGISKIARDITRQKQAEKALAEAVRRQAALYKFVQRRSEAKCVTEIHAAALDAVIALLQCDRAAIVLFDEQGVMRFVASTGLSRRYRKAVEGHSPWRPGTTDPQPVCLHDVDLADAPLKSAITSEGIKSLAFIPLVARKRLIGNMMIYYNAPHDFSRSDLNLVNTIGRQLAHGIDRKQAEEALHESEQRSRAMIEQATVGIGRADRQGRLLFVNKPFCDMLGYRESELIGQPIRMFTYKHETARTAALFGRLIRQGKPYELEKRYVRKDGSVIWVNVSASPVRDIRGKVQSAVAVVVDVTDRKKAETELRRSKKMLEILVQRRTRALRATNAELKREIERRKGLEGDILAVSDREQQRLGRELHDSLCQDLSAIGLMAHCTALRLKNHRVIQVEDLEKIAELISNSVIEARNIARDLHKEEINAADFKRALHDLAERKIWSTPCRLNIATQFEIESDSVASEVYRILREALTNVSKHARATQTLVEVRRRRDELIFSVTDNGVGLDAKARSGDGLGFHIMSYRAKSIGAYLEVQSPANGGTRVSVHLPNGAATAARPNGSSSRSR